MMLDLSKFGGATLKIYHINRDDDCATAPPPLNVKFRSNQSNWSCDKKVYDRMLVNFKMESCKALTAR